MLEDPSIVADEVKAARAERFANLNKVEQIDLEKVKQKRQEEARLAEEK